ncbi:hypothetical protein CLOM_g17376 [Closterium sp. NIES-68]|nr:hypothetical protein CLOM_g17376 [Closterium sp. NIES-68]
MDPLAGLEESEEDEEEDGEEEEEDEEGEEEEEEEKGEEESSEAAEAARRRKGGGRSMRVGKGRWPSYAPVLPCSPPCAHAAPPAAPPSRGVDYAALVRHGLVGGPSVLLVPEEQQTGAVDWGKWGRGQGREGKGRGQGQGDEAEEGDGEGERERRRKAWEESQQLKELASDAGAEAAAARALAHGAAARQLRADIAAEHRERVRQRGGRGGERGRGGGERGGRDGVGGAMSFSQREKRKRDAGQASRGKNYVEEEKRQLRDQGVYSGFDA